MESEYRYLSILLHALPDNLGWQLYGIKYDFSRELILSIRSDHGKEEIEKLAYNLAEKLALWPEPDID